MAGPPPGARNPGLAAHDCIIDMNFRDPHLWPLGDAPGAPVTGRLRFSNAKACLQAVKAGWSIICVPAFVSDEAIRVARIRPLLRDFETESYDVHLLYSHSRHLAAKVRLLVDALVERYRDIPHGEQGW